MVQESRAEKGKHEIYISQADLTLPSFELYSNKASRDLLKKYLWRVVKILRKQTGTSLLDKNVEEQVEDLVNFEMTLALISRRPDLAKLRLIHLTEADARASISPTWGPWKAFLNDLWMTLFKDESEQGLQSFTGQESLWFQIDFLNSLRDILAPFFEIKTPWSEHSRNCQ